MKISIIYHLSNYQYSQIQKQFHQFKLLHESLDLVFITKIFQDCHDQISNHLKGLFESIDLNLQNKNYQQLSIDFSRCKDAKCLPEEFGVNKNYNHRILALNHHLIETGNKIISNDQNGEERGKWSIDCNSLDDLKLINHHLKFVLFENNVKSHGYNYVIKWVEDSITLVNKRCEDLLGTLNQLILSQGPNKNQKEPKNIFNNNNNKQNNNNNNKSKNNKPNNKKQSKNNNNNNNKYQEEEETAARQAQAQELVQDGHCRCREGHGGL